MKSVLANSAELLQSTWIPGVGSVTPSAAASPTAREPRPRRALPIKASMLGAPAAKFVVPASNEALTRLLVHAAREAARQKSEAAEPAEDAEDADDADDADGADDDDPKPEQKRNNRVSKSVDPYVARTKCLMSLFDETTGTVPTSLSVDAHPLQRKLFDAIFAEGGPLEQHGDKTSRIGDFYASAVKIAQNISWLVRHAISDWNFDVVVVRTARSLTHRVDTDRFPNSRFLSWNPFQKLHRVVYVRNGEMADSFRDEILRDLRDVVARPDGVSEETKERFKTPFYTSLHSRLNTLRNSMVDNEASRAKDVPTTNRRRVKCCDERRAYPVLGPLDYHFYLDHAAAIATVAACFDADTFVQRVDPLPDAVVGTCSALRAAAGISGASTAAALHAFARVVARQHHYEVRLQATCRLHAECFLLMIKPSGDFMIDDMEVRNGLFVLSAAQSNTKKDADSSNNEDLWLIKVIHHVLKIFDGRLNDRNFLNVVEPQQVRREKRHLNGGLGHKAADMTARIEANLVAVVSEKIFAYTRMRFDAFHASDRLDGKWLDVAKTPQPNARREKLLHLVNSHKGDVQGAVAAYNSRPTRKECMADAAGSSADAGTLVTAEGPAPAVPRVGSMNERISLDIDCAIVEAVIHCVHDTHDTHDTHSRDSRDAGAAGGSTAVVVADGGAETAGARATLVVAGVVVQVGGYGASNVAVGDGESDDEARVVRDVFGRACVVIGWLSLSRRLAVEQVAARCDAMVAQVQRAKRFCDGLVAIHEYLKPIYNAHYTTIVSADRTTRNLPENALDVGALADMERSGSELVRRAFAAACDDATKNVRSPAYGMKKSVVCKMLDDPSRWTTLATDVHNDMQNMQEAAELISKYKACALACGEPVFFDFTSRLQEYVGALTACRNAVVEEGATDEQPVGLAEHSPKKSELNFVKTRIDAFEKQRDAWNASVLESVSLSLQLCGSWLGLDCAAASRVSTTKQTHVKVAV